MNRPTWLALVLFLVVGRGFAATKDEPTASRIPGDRPNIVFIYTDDQARWAVGAYGNRDVRTPNLDRLAREGAIFQNAFTATPVCSPSRASMMTGLYSTRLGIDDWIDPAKEPALGLSPSRLLWPEVLRGAGYTNILLGKWHLGTRDEFHPTRQGYEVFHGFRAGGNKPLDPRLEIEGREQVVKGSLPDLLVDRAVGFLESNRTRPFLVSLHFREPHAPYAPAPEVDTALFRNADPAIPAVPGLPTARVKELLRQYYASVHSVDRNVGRVLDALDRLGIASKTIVIATSDHGYMIGHHGLWHKGNASWIVAGKSGPRPNMFDDSIRVPLVVRWPAKIQPGTTVKRHVSNVDIFPTILDLVGIGVPENLAIDGRSFAPELVGGKPAASEDPIFGQYDMHHYTTARMRLIRTPEWKLIRHFEPGGIDELYDLKSDPGETTNRIDQAELRPVRRELSRRLQSFMQAHHDPLAAQATPYP